MRRRHPAALVLVALLAGCGFELDLSPDDRYASTDVVLDDIRQSPAFDAPPFRGSTLEPERDPPAQVAHEEGHDDLGPAVLDSAELMEDLGIAWTTATCAGSDGRLVLALDGVDATDGLTERFDVHLATGEDPGTIVLRVALAPRSPLPVPDPDLDPTCPDPLRDRLAALVG